MYRYINIFTDIQEYTGLARERQPGALSVRMNGGFLAKL